MERLSCIDALPCLNTRLTKQLQEELDEEKEIEDDVACLQVGVVCCRLGIYRCRGAHLREAWWLHPYRHGHHKDVARNQHHDHLQERGAQNAGEEVYCTNEEGYHEGHCSEEYCTDEFMVETVLNPSAGPLRPDKHTAGLC